MEILIGFILSFIILIYGVLKDIYIGYSLSLSFVIFFIVAYKMGNTRKEILHNALLGGKKALVVLRIFLLIGLVTASWLSAGTIPSIVSYSMKIMNPKYFVVFTFLTSSLVSYMLGTSLGTASTVGLVLIIMARSGGINLNLVGGAVLSGCYFGDRASPMSSSANLVSNLTGADLYPMLKKFMRTTIIPFIVTSFIYLLLSFSNPLHMEGNMIIEEIHNNFTINFIVLLPALSMLLLSLLQIDVKKSMMVSIVLGLFIALFIQDIVLADLFNNLIFGYRLEPANPLSNILKGGGLLSMIKPAFVVFVSCSMSGILECIGLFKKLHGLFENIKTRGELFLSTAIISLFAVVFGGNQSIAIVMVSEIMRNIYKDLKIDEHNLATDISNTAVLFAAIIPWNIANLVPATTMDLNPVKIVPYAFYLYIPFITNYIYFQIKRKEPLTTFSHSI